MTSPARKRAKVGAAGAVADRPSSLFDESLLDAMALSDLVVSCTQFGLQADGSRQELIARLRAFNSRAFLR